MALNKGSFKFYNTQAAAAHAALAALAALAAAALAAAALATPAAEKQNLGRTKNSPGQKFENFD